MDAQFVSSLEETLKQTLVPDSSVIKQASSKLTKDFYPNPIALPALLQISQTTKQDEIKQLSLVEARKLALDQWETVDASLKPTLRESLLKGTFEEQNKRLRNLSAYVIAAIGEVDLDKNEWQDLLPTLFSAVQNTDVHTREVGTFVLFALLESQIATVIPHISDLLSLFGTLLNDSESKEVRINSIMSLDVISQIIEEDEERTVELAGKFQSTVPSMINIFKDVIR